VLCADRTDTHHKKEQFVVVVVVVFGETGV
jgi:hypothetical protein